VPFDISVQRISSARSSSIAPASSALLQIGDERGRAHPRLAERRTDGSAHCETRDRGERLRDLVGRAVPVDHVASLAGVLDLGGLSVRQGIGAPGRFRERSRALMLRFGVNAWPAGVFIHAFSAASNTRSSASCSARGAVRSPLRTSACVACGLGCEALERCRDLVVGRVRRELVDLPVELHLAHASGELLLARDLPLEFGRRAGVARGVIALGDERLHDFGGVNGALAAPSTAADAAGVRVGSRAIL
jgi:hypothetical protein